MLTLYNPVNPLMLLAQTVFLEHLILNLQIHGV